METTNEDLKKLITETSGSIRKDIKDIKEELLERIVTLEVKEQRRARENRKCNIVIHGIPDTDIPNYQLKKNVIEKLQYYFEQNLSYIIIEARRIGKLVGKRPILARINTEGERNMIFDQAKLIKEETNIVISGDYDKKQREEYGKLMEVKKYLRNKFQILPKIAGNRIIVNKNSYTYDEVVKKFEIPTDTRNSQTPMERESSIEDNDEAEDLNVSTPTHNKGNNKRTKEFNTTQTP